MAKRSIALEREHPVVARTASGRSGPRRRQEFVPGRDDRQPGRSGRFGAGGYATTAEAFKDFIAHNDLSKRIFDRLATLDVEDVNALTAAGKEIRGWVIDAPLQPQLDQDIRTAYAKLSAENGGGDVAVAVRSSATAEDLPDASFAGQQETFLNVTGADDVVHKVKEVPPLYNDRAIAYRVHHGFKHEDVFLSAGVQLMVRSGVGLRRAVHPGHRVRLPRRGVRHLVRPGRDGRAGRGQSDEYYVYKPTAGRQAGDPAPLARQQGDPHGVFGCPR